MEYMSFCPKVRKNGTSARFKHQWLSMGEALRPCRRAFTHFTTFRGETPHMGCISPYRLAPHHLASSPSSGLRTQKVISPSNLAGTWRARTVVEHLDVGELVDCGPDQPLQFLVTRVGCCPSPLSPASRGVQSERWFDPRNRASKLYDD